MTTESEAPAGAGLAGSSTLNIACIGALNKLVGDRYYARPLYPDRGECRVPGHQGADRLSGLLFGTIRRRRVHSFRPRGYAPRGLDIDTATLEERIACYTRANREIRARTTGRSRNAISTATASFSRFSKAFATRLAHTRMRCLTRDWDAVGEILARRLSAAQTPFAEYHNAAYGLI